VEVVEVFWIETEGTKAAGTGVKDVSGAVEADSNGVE